MKQLSAIEVLYMTRELQQLIKARLSQIYQYGKKEILLQFHMPGKGRALLKVRVPFAVYLASGKDAESSATGFCSLLRKKLNNSTLTAVKQPGFERILQLDFSSKNGRFSLFFELFSKGNIILAQDGTIAAAAERQAWSSREVAVGKPHQLPPAVTDPRSLDDKQLLQMLKSTNKTDLVRFIALELSLGGTYAEELCLLSGIDKKTKPDTITASAAKKVLLSLQKLLNSKLFPSIIYENSTAKDVVPISLSRYETSEKKAFDSYSSALEAFFRATEIKQPTSYDSEISRLKAILQHQQETIENSKNQMEKNRKAGELIYENYQEIKALLDTINSVRKTSGWQAVKQLQKTNKKLKSIDEKTGRIRVELTQ